MSKLGLALWFCFSCLPLVATPAATCPAGSHFTLLAHGGAGSWQMKLSHQTWYRNRFAKALAAGYAILKDGGSSLDAVQATVETMEDDGAFNTGKGGVHTSEGTVELDASLMDGKRFAAGAVASVKTVKNPIAAARAVMDKTWHVLLVGPGAEKFAEAQGLEKVDPSYFKQEKPDDGIASRHGTVGAVAVDCFGNLAAATSTGGLDGKLPGRVGDSPIIGAGTYANNETCAISGTGDGEYFIRSAVGHDISAMVEYKAMSVADAATAAIAKVGAHGGTGGVIVIDRKGNMATPFNTPAMLHGYVREDGVPVIDFH